MNAPDPSDNAISSLVAFGRQAYARGWVPATSGNFSCRVPDGIAITVSGRDKGRLTEADIMRLDDQGRAADARRPSAETGLHVMLYRRFPQAHAVLHTHSANATVLSMLSGPELRLHGYEVLKAFPDVGTHEARMRVPVFDNDQDIGRLSRAVEADLQANGPVPGFLIRGHGLYAWGTGVDDAARQVEAYEFLFECEILLRRIAK
jgi:methylthioribulose-1-phosphate dehydratase